jgi:tight adherence protein C
MSAGWWSMLICIGMSTAAVALLCLHTFMRHRTDDSGFDRPPPFISGVRWPALLVTPLLEASLPRAYVEGTRQMLDSHGWLPQLTPQLWVASRLIHAVVAAGLVLAVFGVKSWLLAGMAGLLGYLGVGLWLRRLRQERERQVVRELPAYLDLLTVCVEAGATLTAGVRLIVAQAPATALRGYFERVLREVRGGRPRAEAFVHVATIHNVESLTTLANALAHAEGTGMSLGQVLRTQSEQRTAERFARAERLAMQAPVKMLGPLIFCIFPCTFIVLAVPIVVRMLEVFRS